MARVVDQRKTALSARRGMTARKRRAASQAACLHLARLPTIRRARRIGIYRPLASEIDPRFLIGRTDNANTGFYYPRVENDTLRFVAARSGDRWRRSPLGVDEPDGWGHAVSVLDVLILPLAGFDHAAHRIGLGGGFYDRTLAAVRACPYRSPVRIGLAFECQRLDTIEPRPWDIELTAVVTEAGVHCRARAMSVSG